MEGGQYVVTLQSESQKCNERDSAIRIASNNDDVIEFV